MKGKRTNPYHIQFRPDIETGRWLERLAKARGVRANQVAQQIVVAARYDFGSCDLPVLDYYASECKQEFEPACLMVRTLIDSADEQRLNSGQVPMDAAERRAYVTQAVERIKRGQSAYDDELEVELEKVEKQVVKVYESH